jgi:hypothetical protein
MDADDRLTNGSQVNPLRSCSRENWELGNRIEGSRFFAGTVKFPLEIELDHFHIAQGHADVSVSHHLHQRRQADAEARRNAGVKAGDVVTIILEPDTEKREIEIPLRLQKALGAKLTQKLNDLSVTHKKEFIVWYSEAKQEDTHARRVKKMRQMLTAGKVIS